MKFVQQSGLTTQTYSGDPREWPVGTYMDGTGSYIVLVYKVCGGGVAAVFIGQTLCESAQIQGGEYYRLPSGHKVEFVV